MDWQTAFNIAFSFAGAGVLLYVQTTRDEIKSLRAEMKTNQQTIADLRELIPTKYATTDAVEKRLGEIFAVLARIESKIDTKADKK